MVNGECLWLPSGKHTKNYWFGTSPCLMGQSTINGPFSMVFLYVYQAVNTTKLG